MQWVVQHLKSILRREKMIGTKHRALSGDQRYKISADFASDRIPQLTKAIEVLEQYKEPKTKEKSNVTNQLRIWADH